MGKKRIRIVLCSCLALLTFGCDSFSEDRAYSFFVAGHTYGSPSTDSLGLYPPFRATFPELNADPLIVKGFLTGDIVKIPNEDSWDRVDLDLEKLDAPVSFAPGNHDLKDYDLYQKRYAPLARYFFIEDDLFVIPEVQMDGWNIEQNQLNFYTQLTANQAQRIEHIFIFVHQVIFMDCVPLIPNSSEGRAERLNFETVILPIIEATNKPTYLFAGDVGAFDWGTAVFYEQMNNVTYIASGMGGGVYDNYLIVDVGKDESVKYRIIGLNGQEMRKIDDY